MAKVLLMMCLLLVFVALLAFPALAAAPFDLVAAKHGGKIISFTSQYYLPELGEDWSAKNLIDGGVITKGWSSRDATFPQEIVFAFNDEQPNQISAVMLDPRTADAPALGRGVKDFEIYVSMESPQGPWTKVGTFTMTQTQQPQVFTFSPVKARYVKLSILSNQGSKRMVELGEFAVYHSATEVTPPQGASTATTTVVTGDVAQRLDELISRLEALLNELRHLRAQYKVGDQALLDQINQVEAVAQTLLSQ